MKKPTLKMSGVLLVSVLSIVLLVSLPAFSATPMLGAKATNNNADSAIPALGQKIPLTNDQINAMWPNLPTANQLYGNELCAVIDLRYCGKQVSSMDEALPDPNSPTVIDMNSTIVNCTTTLPDYLHGGVIVNSPQIWLQYNSSIWVQVPSQYLQTTVTPTGAVQQQPTTWAVGMWANPGEITDPYDVWGVCTFGQWRWTTFGGAGMYLGTNVLTVCSRDNIGYQEVMQLDPGGRSIVYNVWNLTSGNHVKGQSPYITNANTGQMYNIYIRYTTGAGWQLWWNFTLMWSFTFDPSTLVMKGSQANTVVETNDFNSSDFSGFVTNIGGSDGHGHPVCAAVYLFNGSWKPSAHGDYAPAGYTYLGGASLNGIKIGDQAPPSSLNIGEAVYMREIFQIGAGPACPQRIEGYML